MKKIFLLLMGLTISLLINSCATLRVSKIDFSYFEKFKQPGHRLIYIASETNGIIPRGDLYVNTNPDDPQKVYSTPVYIPNHKTDGGRGLAVFSLPKGENKIYIRFHGVENNYGSLTQINQRGTCTIDEDVEDVFINVTLMVDNDKKLFVMYQQWYDPQIIHQNYISCTGKYGYYDSKPDGDGQLGFIKPK